MIDPESNRNRSRIRSKIAGRKADMENRTIPPKRTRTALHRVRSAILTLVVCQLLSGLASAIEIEDTRWGFNGKVALNRFNVLSVLVRNSTPQPYDGEMVLRKSLGGAGFVDAKIVEPVSLAPFSSKWVQFYPYINSGWGNTVGNETWRLFHGRGEFLEIPQPRAAKYQRVILDDATGLSARGGILKRMPENLFPAFVSATDALQVVAMDREPRSWIPTQKEAFLDWVHLGGTVLLMHGATGKFPEFSGPLAVLNSPLEERRYGTGRILKVGMQRAQFDEDVARRVFVDLPKNHLQPNEKPEDPIDYVDPSIQNQVNTGNMYGEGADPFSASSFLGQLKEMTKPEHNWILLHFMFWVYIAMIFPGCYILGKRWSDFRVVYAGLLGTVILFSFLFSIVGQRGYGEATAVHTVAIARSLPDAGLDVASWSNVFVTGGAVYPIKHNGIGALYSTCNESEQVNGVINNGIDGTFVVDIPPFSNREFAMRIKVPSGSPKITVDSHTTADSHLSGLVLNVEGLTSTDTEFVNVVFGDRFYTMHWQEGQLKQAADAGDAAAMLKVQNMQNWSSNRGYSYGNEPAAKSAQERFRLMYTPLLSRSLNVARENEARQVRIPPDMLRVYLYAKMPPEFAVQNASLGGQNGQVLYCVDVPLGDAPPDKK